MLSAFDRLTLHAGQWQVTIDKTFETESSLLAFGVRREAPVVLKISKSFSDEWHSGDILRAFAGDGMVRVYESEDGAVLLEQLTPGNQLVELVRDGDDERATGILADVMKQIANHAAPAGCPSVLDWARGFDRYLNTADKQVPAALVHKAQQLYLSLATSSSRTMLLHGDLHHYNVLFDVKRGWVAIDPKGVVGELEYEVGAILRNPWEQANSFASRPEVERRLRILSDALQLDYRRSLQWSFAQAVLSAIWDVEDGKTIAANHAGLSLARTIETMLS
ncbi:MAG: aminoglycoside phosphotransferase family protein [Pyrinomonadaceae bacterium]